VRWRMLRWQGKVWRRMFEVRRVYWKFWKLPVRVMLGRRHGFLNYARGRTYWLGREIPIDTSTYEQREDATNRHIERHAHVKLRS
jgi:hypothetical protein